MYATIHCEGTPTGALAAVRGFFQTQAAEFYHPDYRLSSLRAEGGTVSGNPQAHVIRIWSDLVQTGDRDGRGPISLFALPGWDDWNEVGDQAFLGWVGIRFLPLSRLTLRVALNPKIADYLVDPLSVPDSAPLVTAFVPRTGAGRKGGRTPLALTPIVRLDNPDPIRDLLERDARLVPPGSDATCWREHGRVVRELRALFDGLHRHLRIAELSEGASDAPAEDGPPDPWLKELDEKLLNLKRLGLPIKGQNLAEQFGFSSRSDFHYRFLTPRHLSTITLRARADELYKTWLAREQAEKKAAARDTIRH